MADGPSQGRPEALVAQPKRPLTVLSGPYGHPFHPLFVTVPIGAWVASLIFDLVSRQSDQPGVFAQSSYWLIAIGVIGAFVAAAFGLLDLLNVPRGTRAFRVGLIHMTLNLTVVAAFSVSWVIRISQNYAEVPVWLILYSAATLGVLAVSGWLGGQLTYRYGVRVVDESKQSEGFRPPRMLRRSA